MIFMIQEARDDNGVLNVIKKARDDNGGNDATSFEEVVVLTHDNIYN